MPPSTSIPSHVGNDAVPGHPITPSPTTFSTQAKSRRRIAPSLAEDRSSVPSSRPEILSLPKGTRDSHLVCLPMAIGSDLSVVVGIDAVGLNRAKFARAAPRLIKEAFRQEFRGDRSRREILPAIVIEDLPPGPCVLSRFSPPGIPKRHPHSHFPRAGNYSTLPYQMWHLPEFFIGLLIGCA